MSFTQTLALPWSEFVIHYKLIKHLTELSALSFYGEYSLYLHLPTKTKVLVKEISFSNQEQFKYIVQEIHEAVPFNQCQALCQFINYCVRLHPQTSNMINQNVHLQKSGQILLLYQNYKSLEQIVKQMLNSSKTKQNTLTHPSSSSSPPRYLLFLQCRQPNQYFSEKTLRNIYTASIQFVNFLKTQQIQLIRGISLEMIQICQWNQVDEKCKYFLYPFVQNQVVQMIKENKLQVQQTFVGSNILKLINQQQNQGVTKRILQSNQKCNHFDNINLQSSPTFGPNNSLCFEQQDVKNLVIQNLYNELSESVGLLLLKLMQLALGHQKYLQYKIYQINQSYQLTINQHEILSSLLEINDLNIYSKKFISQIESLIFNLPSANKLSNLTKNKQKTNNTISRNASMSESYGPKSVQKNCFKPSKSPIKLTPSKKNSTSTSKILSKSRRGLNQNLKEQKKFVNPYPFCKSQSKSKPKHKSASFHLHKPQNLSYQQPKQFSPTIDTKEKPSNKKGNLIIIPLQQSKKQTSQSNLPQAIVEKLKAKILYDKNGKLYPNMTEKKFRDGSTYFGQYNPHLNIKEGNGLYFYFEGDVYGGTWKNNQLNGLGIYYFANGDSYQGEVVNGQKEGFGVYHYANGNIYAGSWKNDKKQDEGCMSYANGDSYKGNFVDGRKEGFGIYTWLNGDIYQGQFIKNLKNGKGVFRPVNSNISLQCQWQNDKIIDMQKVQIIYNHSNKVYQGQIKSNGTIEGQGRLSFDQNGLYQGYIKNNSYQGECVIHYPNGDIYKGQIMNNLFEGYGEYYFKQKMLTYVGYWHGGKQQGEGKLIDAKGSEIISNWQKGRIGGKGSIHYSSREKYQGEINQNGRHGDGKYYFQSGQWIVGRFQNNVLIQVYTTM